MSYTKEDISTFVVTISSKAILKNQSCESEIAQIVDSELAGVCKKRGTDSNNHEG